MAGASMKEIKLRIKSVESTMQITKAMELVASSKLRRAKERAERCRPFFLALHETLTEIADSNRDFSSPYTAVKPIEKTCFVVIAGDRGLAGGYNANAFKLASAQMEGKNVCVLPIGKKAVEHFSRRGCELLSREYDSVEQLASEDCREVAELLTEGFLAGRFDELVIVYTSFVSMLVQDAAHLRVLPIHSSQAPPSGGPVMLRLYEPSPLAVYDAIVPQYVTGVLACALSESLASELGARRTAMESASKNAGDMIDELSLRYNRARQGAITQEITEIVAGAEQ
ncbi:MAG: ATP synthase F1 subunit gamma [Clostridia bacterium]|nr:ATP synthase F1 subunit gamma [Clostridia bacterium]